MAFAVMCAEKIRNLLRVFFVIFHAWIYTSQRPVCLWMFSGIFGGLRQENYCSLHNRASRLLIPLDLDQNREGLLLFFQAAPIIFVPKPGRRLPIFVGNLLLLIS